MQQDVTFGYWLRLKRKALDLTREGLAERVGCSAASIRKLEAEERRPSAQMAERLAEIFEIPQKERAAFLRYTRGDWMAVPHETAGDEPWRQSAELQRPSIPSPANAIIGRDRELARIGEYLSNPNVRLVTLIGPPGIGKTRLSIEVARAAQLDFMGKVYFVALAPLDNPAPLETAIAQVLGYVTSRNLSSKEQLVEGIGEKKMLLVLDNCEHLIESVASLATELLSFCSRIKILVTSRESLRIPGEWLYPVPPLDVPINDSKIDLADIARFPALTLFSERARAVRADFALDSGNIAVVSAICARLDGLPLAIELIAARIRLMSPQELWENLNSQLMLSADGGRVVSARLKNLRNAIEWSYNLLPQQEKTSLARLAVFSGGFTLDMAEAILSQSTIEESASNLIASLMDKSLLKRAYGALSQTRFTMLVTIQQFALECLRRSGEETETRNRHLAYFLILLEKADQARNGPEQLDWLDRLSLNYDNLRVVLEWAFASGNTEAALKIACCLSWYWFKRSDFTESCRWLISVIALPNAPLYPELHAEAFFHLATIMHYQGKMEKARFYVEQCLRVSQAHADRRNTANIKLLLDMILIDERRFAEARIMNSESRALFRELGDEWELEAHSVFHLAQIAYQEGDLASALALHQQSLASCRKFGDLFYQGPNLRYIGILLVMQGQVRLGKAALREALYLSWEFDSKIEISSTFELIIEAFQIIGDLPRAICLAWAMKNINDTFGIWWKDYQDKFERDIAAWRAVMTEEEYNTAAEQGRAMTLEQAVTFALEEDVDRFSRFTLISS